MNEESRAARFAAYKRDCAWLEKIGWETTFGYEGGVNPSVFFIRHPLIFSAKTYFEWDGAISDEQRAELQLRADEYRLVKQVQEKIFNGLASEVDWFMPRPGTGSTYIVASAPQHIIEWCPATGVWTIAGALQYAPTSRYYKPPVVLSPEQAVQLVFSFAKKGYSSGGGSESTSVDSDGFWNK